MFLNSTANPLELVTILLFIISVLPILWNSWFFNFYYWLIILNFSSPPQPCPLLSPVRYALHFIPTTFNIQLRKEQITTIPVFSSFNRPPPFHHCFSSFFFFFFISSHPFLSLLFKYCAASIRHDYMCQNSHHKTSPFFAVSGRVHALCIARVVSCDCIL